MLEPSNLRLDCAGKLVDLSRPRVMGILNVTPDSFSDGGRFQSIETAVKHGLAMADAGASFIDIGGESTRPGAKPVSIAEELDRVIPVIEKLNSETDVPISIDTSKAPVMREAVRAGASFINDVNALRSDGALSMAAELQVPVCLMHMQGQPRSMQLSPEYANVVLEVQQFLQSRVEKCLQAGIPEERLIVDPGFGFGKSLQHNVLLLQHLADFVSIGLPVLIGISRKSMLDGLLGGNTSVDERIHAGLAAAVIAVFAGAKIIRTHDVKATVDALQVADTVLVE